MKQNLYQFFQSKKKEHLDVKTKEILFTVINKKIKNQFGIMRSVVYRSKLVSTWLVVALFFSILQYTLIQYSSFTQLANYFRGSNFAQADYIGTIVSWVGTYKVVYNDQIVDTKKTDNQIPAGWSLFVEHWSKVSFKTKNNATADIVWPAKVTFQKQQNNELVVDIAYSDHIDIKQQQVDNNTTSSQTDVLIIKTDDKIITSTTQTLDITLDTKGDSQTIKNNNGEVAIASSGSNKIVALKSNESALLDAEIKLFAVELPQSNDNQVDTYNDGVESDIIGQITLPLDSLVDSNELNVSGVVVWNTGWLLWDVVIAAKMDVSTMTRINEDKNDMNELKEEKIQLDESASGVQIDQTSVSSHVNSLDVLLDTKQVLNWQILGLLNELYEWYHKNNQDLVSVSDVVLQLCAELHIVCSYKELPVALFKINKKINENYIITSDVKFVIIRTQ